MLNNLSRIVKLLTQPRRTRTIVKPRPCVRLHVETLEDRSLPSVSITSPGTLNSYDGDAVNLAVQYTDTGSSPSFMLNNGPAGLSIDTTGHIVGAISSTAHFLSPMTVTVGISDMMTFESDSAQFTWNVSQPTVSLTDPGLPHNFDGDTVSQTLIASSNAGHSLAYSYTGMLPDGLALNQTSGEITGTLSSAAHYMSPYSATVTATDNAGGVSDSKTLTWWIGEANHAPSFSASDPAAVDEASDPVSIANWASFNAGSSDESWQTATYVVSNVSNPDLFSVLPAVNSSGTLSYTLADYGSGTTTFDVKVIDNGGTSNGGVDASAFTTFSIQVQTRDSFIVRSNADDGRATLRNAIRVGSNPARGDTPFAVTFVMPAGSETITLTYALVPLRKNFTITGPDNQVTIRRSGGASFRLFTILSGNDIISNLTLTNGIAEFATNTSDRRGGAIYVGSDAGLDVSWVHMSGNSASLGGGAIANDGNLTVFGCELTYNSTASAGGAIDNRGIATVSDTQILVNSARNGGGIFNRGAADGNPAAQLTINAGTDISGNTATGVGDPVEFAGRGGGIDNYGSLTISDAYIWGNTSVNEGGGLFTNTSASLTNVNIQNNSATSVTRGKGGGIYVLAGTSTLVSGCTISGNFGRWINCADGVMYNSNANVVPNLDLNPDILDPVAVG